MAARSTAEAGRTAASRATAEYALLGLLARAETGGIHGYDLARAFGESVVAQIVRLEPGMLYHYLKRLSKDGLLRTRVERQDGRPDRQVHAITPEGEEALRGWIASPVQSTREVRLEFLLKLYLARQVDPAQATRLVTEQARVMRSRRDQLASRVDSAQPAHPDHEFGETVLRLRLSQTESALAWLESLPEFLD